MFTLFTKGTLAVETKLILILIITTLFNAHPSEREIFFSSVPALKLEKPECKDYPSNPKPRSPSNHCSNYHPPGAKEKEWRDSGHRSLFKQVKNAVKGQPVCMIDFYYFPLLDES